MLATAQDNTWERIEQEPVEAANPDAKYLLPNAVPVVDGKVCWTTTISAPGKSAQQIFDILLAQLQKMVKEPNQIAGSAIVVNDTQKHDLGAVFHEWLVFNKDHTKLYPLSAKFRRKTIDRKDYIFNKFNTLLNDK